MAPYGLQRLGALLGAHDAVVHPQRRTEALLKPSNDRVENLRRAVSVAAHDPPTGWMSIVTAYGARHGRTGTARTEQENATVKSMTMQKHMRDAMAMSGAWRRMVSESGMMRGSARQRVGNRTRACLSASCPGSSRQQALSVCRYCSIVSITISRGLGYGTSTSV